jgi:hypothetical protein
VDFVRIISVDASSRRIRSRRLAAGVTISYEVGSTDEAAANSVFSKLEEAKEDNGAAFKAVFDSEASSLGLDTTGLGFKVEAVARPSKVESGGEQFIAGPKEVEQEGMTGTEAAMLFFLVLGLLACIFVGYKVYEKQQDGDNTPQRTPAAPGAAAVNQTSGEAKASAPVNLGDVEPSLQSQVRAKATAEDR